MYKTAMESQYDFRTEASAIFLQIKNNQDFGFRIRPIEGESDDHGVPRTGFRLDKAYSPRNYIKPTYKKVRDFVSVEMALLFIIKRHNKACAYMEGWIPISI